MLSYVLLAVFPKQNNTKAVELKIILIYRNGGSKTRSHVGGREMVPNVYKLLDADQLIEGIKNLLDSDKEQDLCDVSLGSLDGIFDMDLGTSTPLPLPCFSQTDQ